MNDEQGLPGSDSELGGRDEKRRPQQACPLSFLVRVFSFYIFDWFGFTINLMFLAVPKLLYNRLHCLSVGRHYLHDLTVNCKAILETCDPWDMWSKWQPDLTNQPTYLHANLHTNPPTFVQSDEETLPDQHKDKDKAKDIWRMKNTLKEWPLETTFIVSLR